MWAAVSKSFSLMSSFIIRTVITYTLGAQYLGLSSLFTSILTVLSLADLGFGEAVIYSMHKPLAQGDTDGVCALMSFYRRVYAIIGTVVLVIGCALLPFLPKLISGTYPADINLYALYLIYLSRSVLSYWVFAYKSCILTATQRSDVSSKIVLLLDVVTFFLQLLILLAFSSFYAYAAMFPLVELVKSLIRARLITKMYPQYVCKGTLSREKRMEIRRQVTGIMVEKLCHISQNSLDNIIISFFLGLAAVAVYANYFYIMNNVFVLLLIPTTAMLASVGNKIASASPQENYRDMNRFNFIFMTAAGWCMSVLCCVFQPFMRIWMGENGMLSTLDMLLMCLCFYAMTTGSVRYVYYEGAGLWWHGRLRAVLETATNLVLNIVLGYFWGVTGVITATIISLVAVNFLYGTQIIHRHYFTMFKASDHYLRHLRYFLVSGAVAAVCYLCCQNLPLGDGFVEKVAWLLARFGICAVIPPILYFLIYHRTKDYRSAMEWLRPKVFSLKKRFTKKAPTEQPKQL